MDASSTHQGSLPVTSDALLARLRDEGFTFSYHEHPPLKTVAESKLARGDMLPEERGGGHIKNLYLRDKKKRNFLAVMQEDAVVDLDELAQRIGAGRLSFGSAERLMQHLGVRPGAVTPLAMVTGAAKGVSLVLDKRLKSCAEIYMHPLVNDRTVGMAPNDLTRFLDRLGASWRWLD